MTVPPGAVERQGRIDLSRLIPANRAPPPIGSEPPGRAIAGLLSKVPQGAWRRLAAVWCRCATRSVPFCAHSGTILRPVWYHSGPNPVPDWAQNGTGLGSNRPNHPLSAPWKPPCSGDVRLNADSRAGKPVGFRVIPLHFWSFSVGFSDLASSIVSAARVARAAWRLQPRNAQRAFDARFTVMGRGHDLGRSAACRPSRSACKSSLERTRISVGSVPNQARIAEGLPHHGNARLIPSKLGVKLRCTTGILERPPPAGFEIGFHWQALDLAGGSIKAVARPGERQSVDTDLATGFVGNAPFSRRIPKGTFPASIAPALSTVVAPRIARTGLFTHALDVFVNEPLPQQPCLRRCGVKLRRATGIAGGHTAGRTDGGRA